MDYPYFPDIYAAYDWLEENDFQYYKKDGHSEFYETKSHTAEVRGHERDSSSFTFDLKEKTQLSFDFSQPSPYHLYPLVTRIDLEKEEE